MNKLYEKSQEKKEYKKCFEEWVLILFSRHKESSIMDRDIVEFLLYEIYEEINKTPINLINDDFYRELYGKILNLEIPYKASAYQDRYLNFLKILDIKLNKERSKMFLY